MKSNKAILTKSQYQSLISLLPVAVYTVDKNGFITFYNEEAARLLGSKSGKNDLSELKYTGNLKMFDLQDNLIPDENWPTAQALHNGTSFREEEVIIEQPDGSRFTILMNIDPIKEDDQINGALVVFIDVTEKRKAEEKQSMLAAIVHSSQDAIISKTLKGDITSWNKGAEAIFGYSEKEIVGKNIRQLIPKDRWIEEDYILSKIEKGEKVEHYKTIRKKKNGEHINISITVSPIKNAKNEVIGASKIARDFTTEAMVQQQLEDYNTRLKQLLEYKDEFLSLVSHEIKTPLACASAYAQILANEALSDEDAQITTQLKKHLNFLNELIEDLLDLNKMETGKLSFKMESVDLYDVIKEVTDLQHLTSTHKINITNLDHFIITGDKARLFQVINNIISNAIKYSPGADKVDVSISKKVNFIEIRVRDYGVGVPKDQVKKIFDKYHRVSENDSNITGLGIGLYITKNIVKRHKGKIRVELPEDGKGSVFTVLLPAQN